MSSDDQRIGTEALLALAEPVHVDTLTRWEGDPYAGDVGIRALQSSTFGQIGLVLTYGPEVLYGEDLVQAQRMQPDDNGLVPVVDLAKAGFSRTKAEATALALWTNHRNSLVDDVLLGELVTSIIQEDAALAMAAGWDGDDLDALLRSLGAPPSLDDVLGGAGGNVDDPENYFTEKIELTLPVPLAKTWRDQVNPLGENDPDRVRALLAAAGLDDGDEQ